MKQEIEFKGNYWWSDAKNVISILKKEFKKILSETRISSIVINGSDFNDGRQNRQIKISISNNKITVEKNYT